MATVTAPLERRAGTSAALRFQVETVDLKKLQRVGSNNDRDRMARRIFELWQPLFTHLADKDHHFHRRKHVEDQRPTVLRAHFIVDQQGSDHGLMIFRVHESKLGRSTVARMTINAGLREEARGSAILYRDILFDLLRYRLSHPLRGFFVVDGVYGFGAYRTLGRFFHLAPSPNREVPHALWPLLEEYGDELEAKRVEGRHRAVRDFSTSVQLERAPTPTSQRSRELAHWFEQQIGAATNGILVVAPLGWLDLVWAALRVAQSKFPVWFRGR